MMPRATAPLITRIDALLFDFDGTLADSIPHILASFQHATSEVLGHVPADEELLVNVGIPLAQQMRLLVDDEDKAERLLVSYRDFNQRTHDDMVRSYPGVIEALEAIRVHGLPMGVVTSKGTAMALKGIELLGLERFLSVLVTADDVPLHKPDPYPVRHAAQELQVDPARVAYIGDSPADIAAARGAGAVAIGATWGVSARERLEAAGPDFMLDDISQVPDLLFGSA